MPRTDAPRTADHFPPGMGWRFGLVYAALFLPFSVVTPYLQVLLRELGYSYQQVGDIQGTLEVLAVLAPPALGYLADRLRRPRLILGLAVAGAGPTMLLFAAVEQLWAALLVATLFGFFFKSQISLTDGLTFRYIHHHGGNYGAVRSAGSIAFVLYILGMEACGVGGEDTVRVIFTAFVVAVAVHLVSLEALPADGEAGAGGEGSGGHDWRIFLRRSFVLFTLAAFLGRLAMMSYYHFFTLFLQRDLGVAYAGVIWVIGPISEIPVLFFSTAIMRRIGVKRLFALGLAGVAVRLLAYGFVTSVWQVLPLQLLHALTFGAYHAASVTYISRVTPPQMKSTAQTLFAACTMGAGGLVGGAIGGRITGAFGFATLYLSFGVVALVALLLLLVAVPAQPEQPEH